MRALVTGGAGFVGSTLVDRLLAEGHVVEVVDDLSTGSLANLAEARSSGGNFSFHQFDIRRAELVDLMVAHRPEVVFHLAAQASVTVSMEQPIHDAEVNILGSLRVIEGARAAGTRKVVYAASGGTLYGDVGPNELPVNESHPMAAISPYGVSKRVAIEYLRLYRETFGLEYTALALANVYGPRQDPFGEAGVVAIFATALAEGRPCQIFGDGRQTRDFVYVDDVVDAFARAATRGSGLVCNIGTGVEVSVNELYESLAGRQGRHAPAVRAAPRPGEVRRSSLDPGRARIHLGWRPFTPLDEGLARVFGHSRARAPR